jgi:hypothetical protein
LVLFGAFASGHPPPQLQNLTTTRAVRDLVFIVRRSFGMLWKDASNSARIILAATSIVAGAMLLIVPRAQTREPQTFALTPAEMSWISQGPLAAPGMEQLNLVGNPANPGPYTLRLKFPKGFRIAPHTHPDSREVTVMSGVYATGYGETFDAARLKVLPAGSFYTEPADVPHYIQIVEDTILQVSGTGPSGRKFVKEPETSK